MPREIWLVTDGESHHGSLGFFSQENAARRYQELLVERYCRGQKLALHGKQLAGDCNAWTLGFGPQVVGCTLDVSPEFLRGAWVVKVDSSCRMFACEFSTQHKPQERSEIHKLGIGGVALAYGDSPHAALDAAKKAMVKYLGRAHELR